MCPQSLEGKALGKCFGRDTEVILEAVHLGKAKVVTWTITCVRVGNGRRVEGGRRLMLCIFLGIVTRQKLLVHKKEIIYLRNQICLKLQSRQRWRPEQGTVLDPTDSIKVFSFFRAHLAAAWAMGQGGGGGDLE